jgi:PPOX class probable F420-dependent enzyme
MASVDEVGAERYVLLSSRKRDGSMVSTPVWIVAVDDDTVGFTTQASAGKVKRIRNFPQVTLQPCNSRGVVAAGAPVWHGDGRVLHGQDATRVIDAIKQKYRWQVTLIDALGAVRSFVKRQPSTTAAIVIRLA